jgi:hypothetical protein
MGKLVLRKTILRNMTDREAWNLKEQNCGAKAGVLFIQCCQILYIGEERWRRVASSET